MNSREPRSKMGLIDHELNYLAKILLCIMCGMAFTIVLTDEVSSQWFL
jgi:phospholipid-translocating ATPase